MFTKKNKYHIYLTEEERRLAIKALIDKRNALIAAGHYTIINYHAVGVIVIIVLLRDKSFKQRSQNGKMFRVDFRRHVHVEF